MARIGTSGHDGALIAALLGGASVEDAARLAGLSRRTAFRRLDDPTFRQALAEAKRARLARVVEVIAAGSLLAVNTLIELLGPETPPSVRHASAKSILELDERRRQQVEVEDRLAAIEVVGHRVHLFRRRFLLQRREDDSVASSSASLICCYTNSRDANRPDRRRVLIPFDFQAATRAALARVTFGATRDRCLCHDGGSEHLHDQAPGRATAWTISADTGEVARPAKEVDCLS
jgi:hypothetical protein